MQLPTIARLNILSAVLFAVVLVAGAGWFLIVDREQTMTAAGQRAYDTAGLVAQHTIRSVQAIDLYVSNWQDRFIEENHTATSFHQQHFLPIITGLSELPQFSEAFLADENGQVLAASRDEMLGQDVSNYPYFYAHVQDRTFDYYVNRPVLSQGPLGRRLVPASWRLDDQSGQFAGILVVNINGAYFRSVFSTALDPSEGFTALFDNRGHLFVLDQDELSTRSTPSPRVDLFTAMARTADDGPDVFQGHIGGDEQSWVAASRTLPSLPIQVGVGFPLELVLADWRTRAWATCGTIVIMIMLLGLLAGSIARASTRMEQAAADALKARDEAESARRESEYANRAKSSFLATISHEIRTPMNAVLGMTQLLLEEDLNRRQRTYAEAVRTAGEGLLTLINDILDLSKLESGRLTLETIDFSLSRSVEEVVTTLTPQAREKGLTLTVDMADGIPAVLKGDPTRIKQVLFNLIGNAIKFTHKGGVSVLVDEMTRADGTIGLRLAVKDTGIGIPPDKQYRLFERFTQADSTTTRRYGGTGLGLAICKQLVTLMGGSIGVDSIEKEGSTFWFTLRLPIGSGDIRPRLSMGGLASLSPLRVLVAEDVAVNRLLMREALQRGGHTVTLVENGQLAVDAVQASDAYDVVLMDIQMPELDGIGATRAIRALGGRFERLPIVALTANAMEGQQREYIEAGMDDCVTKPIDWGRLNAVLAAVTGATGGASSERLAGAPGRGLDLPDDPLDAPIAREPTGDAASEPLPANAFGPPEPDERAAPTPPLVRPPAEPLDVALTGVANASIDDQTPIVAEASVEVTDLMAESTSSVELLPEAMRFMEDPGATAEPSPIVETGFAGPDVIPMPVREPPRDLRAEEAETASPLGHDILTEAWDELPLIDPPVFDDIIAGREPHRATRLLAGAIAELTESLERMRPHRMGAATVRREADRLADIADGLGFLRLRCGLEELHDLCSQPEPAGDLLPHLLACVRATHQAVNARRSTPVLLTRAS